MGYYCSIGIERSCYNRIVEECKSAAYMRDIDGLTPILRAAQCGQIWLVIEIGEKHPESTYISDYRGRNMWHYLCTSGMDAVVNDLEGILKSWEEASTITSLNPLEAILSQDDDGNTPLHLAIMDQNFEAAEIFIRHLVKVKSFQKVMELITEKSNKMGNTPPPWTLKNSKGNTFLHEAARFCKYQVVFSNDLVNGIDVIKDVVNNHVREFLENLPRETQPVVNMKDLEGFTPILKAVKYGRFAVAKLLYKHCQHSIMIVDNKGRTALHHMRASVVDLVDDVNDVLPVWNTFYKECRLDRLRSIQNEDGNTALHSAIIEGNFKKVKFLMEKCIQSGHKQELHIINNMGHTVFDLVSFAGKGR
ncbi:Transient receptor potential cation channel subfamily A member 1, partial [Bienertia sinuspersici]